MGESIQIGRELLTGLIDVGWWASGICFIDPKHVEVVLVVLQDRSGDALLDGIEPAAFEFLRFLNEIRQVDRPLAELRRIRETDAIAHVVRCFDDENVIHVEGQISPADDIAVINTELALADLESAEKALQRSSKAAKGNDKDAKALVVVLEKVITHLNEAQPLRSLDLTDDELTVLKQLNPLTIKPTMYIANVDEDGFENNPYLDAVKEIAAQEGAIVVPICNKLEAEVSELEDDEKMEFLEELGMEEPGLNRVIRAGYSLLGLQTYFTAGPKEVRAWTIPVGATAPNAAGKIHTDFEKGFIRAEVVAYDDYIAGNGEQGAKEAGKWRLEGKDYIVQDGDLIHFRFNV